MPAGRVAGITSQELGPPPLPTHPPGHASAARKIAHTRDPHACESSAPSCYRDKTPRENAADARRSRCACRFAASALHHLAPVSDYAARASILAPHGRRCGLALRLLRFIQSILRAFNRVVQIVFVNFHIWPRALVFLQNHEELFGLAGHQVNSMPNILLLL